ncbi:ParB/RepB/Spo0J family partition protein [Thioalkalivibrio thiocyanodenitrificans]|uniref:ParB/RepB/Spo0J family partition protein n=1 Tax=Thioalkalivibrio thiocyanodenitrificans TaxID=243063 RepID=UPI0003760764|nr:ParB N-terminal domain-containing protein [Thioalkalivibrio thiocyanodenitrificans]
MRIESEVFTGTIRVVPVSSIFGGGVQARPSMVRSIKSRGLRSLPVVREVRDADRERWAEEGFLDTGFEYAIEAGRHRIAAIKELNIQEVPVIVAEDDADETTLVENLVRGRNLISELEALEGLLDAGKEPEDIQKELGIFKRDLNRLRRLSNMGKVTRGKLAAGLIAPSTGEVLAKMPEQYQEAFFKAADKTTLKAAREFLWKYRLPSNQLDFLAEDLPTLE